MKGQAKPALLLAVLMLVALGTLLYHREWLEQHGPTTQPLSTLRSQFEEQVLPVLEKRCSNCHGVTAEQYQELQQDHSNATLLRWVVDVRGRISTPEQRELAYLRCTTEVRHDGHTLRPIDRSSPAIASALLIAPLSQTYSGPASIHPECFATPDDGDFIALRRWVEAEVAAAPIERPLASEAERFFIDKVMPILERKSCFGANCHGRGTVFNDLLLDGGVPILPDRFTHYTHHKNRMAMLGRLKNQTRQVQLAGDLNQSRQLLKNVPIEQGGILHKGGNLFFQVGDPDYAILHEWLELEAAELRRRVGAPLGREQGLVFVRRPTATPERYFEDDAFHGGSELIWFDGQREIHLTEALRNGRPADIRTPDVSYDARHVVFALRFAADEPFNIWELELATRRARQLTFSRNPRVHYRDPIYMPDREDTSGDRLDRVCIAFVSNESGEWALTSPSAHLGEASGGDRQTILDPELHYQAGTFDGRQLKIVQGTNLGATRRVQAQERGKITVDQPFDAACDETTHYIITREPRMASSYDLYRMRRASPGDEQRTFEQGRARLTHALGQIRRPAMRSSGEIMFTALRTGWQSGKPFYNGAIFRTYDNGGNFHTHNGNRSQLPILASNHELPNGLEVRIGMDADSWWGGALIISEHQFGPNIDPHNPNDFLTAPYRTGKPASSQPIFFKGWVSLDPSVSYAGYSAGGVYRDPVPMPDGSILVAYAAGPIDLTDPAAAPDFDIVQILPNPAYQSADGMSAGAFKRDMVIQRAGSSELWPRPVVVRPKESLNKSHKWAEDLVGPPQPQELAPGYPTDTPAHLVVFDLALLQIFFDQSTPIAQHHFFEDGECNVCGETHAAHEQVRYARVVGALPLKEGESGPPQRVILAELPVERDSSFHVMVPSGISFDIQSLNGDRMALRMPNRWLYCLPGEKHTLSIARLLYTEVCSGCHGDLTGERSTSLGRPDAITSASRMLAMWDPERRAKRLPANIRSKQSLELTPAPFSVGFAEDIAPLLERRCTSCHGATEPDAGLDLTGAGAYDRLRGHVAHQEALARRSPLIERLMGRKLDSDLPLANTQAHPAGAALDREELLTLIRWIDLGAMAKRAVHK